MTNIYRDSRAHSGLSQEAASHLIPISEHTIRRWESGESIPDPQYVNRMAVVYDDPSLPIKHCLQNYQLHCIIDSMDVDVGNLAQAALELIELIEPVANDQRRLAAILKDGIIDEAEIPDFERITANLRNFVSASTKLMIRAAKKETAPMGATMRAAG